MLCAGVSCTPSKYRLQADAEVYDILEQKAQHPQWWVPPFSIEPAADSRNSDPYDPDCPPLPPDDEFAHEFMHCASGHRGYRHWHDRGDAESIESDTWLSSLELTADEVLRLAPDRAVELGVVNSRSYQTEMENLYLSALALTLERFEFQLQWFGGNRTFYQFLGNQISGRAPGLESNTLETTTTAGFSRAFTSGGQLLVDFANTFVWEFTGSNSAKTSSLLTTRLVQPLMRGAFREVRMESLTQSERNVLYAARDFARFRKQFYFDIVSGNSGYLSLLLQLQAIRNLEANLDSLEQNLRTHEALAAAGVVSSLRVDQVFQSYQSGQLQLILARNTYNTALDDFKIQLGLPPELKAEIDDSLLTPFELNSDEIVQLQQEIEDLLAGFRQADVPPSAAEVTTGYEELAGLNRRAEQQWTVVESEWKQWNESATRSSLPNPEDDERVVKARGQLRVRLDDLHDDILEMDDLLKGRSDEQLEQTSSAIQRLARRVTSYVSDLFVIQSQIRAYLITLEPYEYTSEEAIDYALNNRLDLMNRRAEVVDAWRHIRVAADALEAGVDLVTDAFLGTSGTSNPVRFSSDTSRFRVGLQFDAPLNRLAERNTYRATLVEYQRARREFIGDRDSIVRAIRLDLRQLDADRLNFEIARQSFVVAARQVELARIQLLAPNQESDSSSTQDALNALNSLLDAKNTLISVWVSYETNRLQLLLETEALQLDERGLAVDVDYNQSANPEPRHASPDVDTLDE